MKKEKFCVDCRHYCSTLGKGTECKSPKNMAYSFVTGTMTPRWFSCKVLREDCWFGSLFLRTCGKNARWFEPKQNEKEAVDALLKSIKEES